MEIECSGLSHIGPVREDNQDSIHIPGGTERPVDTKPSDHHLPDGWGGLYAVADGMGGYEQGKLASMLALEALCQTFYKEQAAPASKNLRRGVESANLGVYQTAQRLGVRRMGTTLTAASVQGRKLHLVHVGDSRAYLIRNRRATCLTNDHTTVGDLVRMRVLSPDKVRTHTQRSILTKCIGLSLFVQPDLTEIPLQEDDRLILCSDGVWSVIQDEEFAELAGQAEGVEGLSQSLIDLALERQTDDNASVVAIHVRQLAPAPVKVAARRSWNWPGFMRRLGSL